MIITSESPAEFHHPGTGAGLDGVVKVSADGHYGTGALLWDGRTLLTAAHIFVNNNLQLPTQTTISFETSSGKRNLYSSNLVVHPDYDSVSSSFDLALITLSSTAPTAADRYTLYRQQDESQHTATLVGYGRQGTGEVGFDDSDDIIRTRAENRLELDGGDITELLGRPLSWEPDPLSLLIADYDSGLAEQDTFAALGGAEDLGQGIYEGLIVQGDSGGPAFIDQKIAGVASYITRFATPDTDIDNALNSSYGEVGFWQRVSNVQQWIDQSVRANYNINTLLEPESGLPDKSKIPLSVSEGYSGSQTLFFLLEFHGTRESEDQILSVTYQTKDGTATAGEDYIATSGMLNLYPGENHAWIPVEILGDHIAEDNETFYMSVTNPIGASFSNGQTELLAVRTILDDDF